MSDQDIKRAWSQNGFAVVSRVAPDGGAGLPLIHGMFLPEWEAKQCLERIADHPALLGLDAAVVPIKISFEF
ncbi:hypothetical protein ABIC83_002870 [Roseateles asaccharophilus]|uniref:hypothetical protein n=1 Tax=Roseateles asaccharophilus TaxID=582607 RepID=UPI003833AB49